jgi:hypothetical protein
LNARFDVPWKPQPATSFWLLMAWAARRLAAVGGVDEGSDQICGFTVIVGEDVSDG